MTIDKSTLESRLAILPKSPGIYLFFDKKNEIIYIGKSNSLKDRISSYFRSNKNFSSKTIELTLKIRDFEFITTDTDQEAILLESSLIKKHKPKYNIRLKDDKNYPYIKVDLNDPFPKIYISRKASDKNSKYFGPFASAVSVRKTLNLLNKLFPYRTCTKKINGKDSRPCLEFHLKRCIAPCTGYADEKDYKTVIDEASLFLAGNTQKVMDELKNSMKNASENMKYEKAALIRDRIKAIENIYEKQQVMGVNFKNTDVINISKDKKESWIEVFFIRNGNLLGRENFMMLETSQETINQVFSLAKRIGVTPLVVDKESTGFIFNRVWRAIKRESLHLVDDGVTTHENVDRAWMIFTGTNMGPFALMDRIGLDVIHDIETVYFNESKNDRDMPPTLLTNLIQRGELGCKTGKGFYSYPNPVFENKDWLRGSE